MRLTERELTSIRAITVGPPFAHAIVTGAKKLENRTWSTKYRGPLLIHAASSLWAEDVETVETRYEKMGLPPLPEELVVASLVGVVTLVDVVHISNPGKWGRDLWFRGPYAFVLARPVMFTEPVDAKGRLQLWLPERSDLRKMSKYLLSYSRS